MKTRTLALLIPLSFSLACTNPTQMDDGDNAVDLAVLDGLFADFSSADGPGCAVAVSRDGQQVLSRGYGSANLEWDIPNTGETVFEPGSVSKQFAAAATIMLVLDGTISLDDDIRDYIPEMPDYGEPITVRMLVNHTSGLRDWGSIAGIEGWNRTTRIHTHKHMLDIASRQRSLNYEPGQYYSYTNTGYNLQAVLVERVSGMTFEEFSQLRIFGPLGMTKTQWRDDFTEIVKHRSVAYTHSEDDGWSMLMPFENVHGNGGLLTTVGDLLKFTHNLDTGEVGGSGFVDLMHQQGVLDSGQEIPYAGGLFVGEYKGVREVQHSGGTAGYRGFLTRFPDHGIAVSLMCNAGSANPGQLAHEVADLYLGDSISEDAPINEIVSATVEANQLNALTGGYRDTRTGQHLEITSDGESLEIGGMSLTPISDTEFASLARGASLKFDGPARGGVRPTAILDSPVDDGVLIEPVGKFHPTSAQLREYTGTYYSDEAEVTYWIEVEDGSLQIKDRYGDTEELEPVYPDAFSQGGTTYIFRRNSTGRITEASLSQSRVWDLRFTRTQ